MAIPGADAPIGPSAPGSETAPSTSAGVPAGSASSADDGVAMFKRLASRNARSAPMSFCMLS